MREKHGTYQQQVWEEWPVEYGAADHGSCSENQKEVCFEPHGGGEPLSPFWSGEMDGGKKIEHTLPSVLHPNAPAETITGEGTTLISVEGAKPPFWLPVKLIVKHHHLSMTCLLPLQPRARLNPAKLPTWDKDKDPCGHTMAVSCLKGLLGVLT